MPKINAYRLELRDKIIDTAMALFAHKGLKMVRMDDIALKMHISKRTVYEIFGDKEALLIAGIQKQHEEYTSQMDHFVKYTCHNVIDILVKGYKLTILRDKKIVPAFYEEIHKYPRVVELLKSLHESKEERSLDFFKEGVEEGIFREDINYPLILKMSNLATDAAMANQLFKLYKVSEICEMFATVMLRGICTPKGAELLEQGMKELREFEVSEELDSIDEPQMADASVDLPFQN